MIFDCHTHLYDEGYCKANEIELDHAKFIERAIDEGIDKIAVSSLGHKMFLADPSEDEISEANNDVLQTVRDFPDQIYGYIYLNPHNKNCMDELKRCMGKGIIGIKLWIAAKASNPLVFPIVEEAIKNNLIILQHTFLRVNGNLTNESDPFDVAFLGDRYPEAKIIMAHAGANLNGGIEAIKDTPNIYVDTSGSYPVRGVVEKLNEQIGCKRILFGSDAPCRSFAVQLTKVQAAEIPDSDKENILSKNFMELITNEKD